jgi:arginyl-tRNA--protein-N-Asp/Glu arginylyltransferase
MSQGVDYLIADEKGFTGELLDMFLAQGYYRMQHAIFTCNEAQIDFDSYSIPVFWLRTILSKIRTQKTGTIIRKKCSSFSVEYKQAAITTEINELYTQYRNQLSFHTAELCEDYLHQSEIPNPFDSWMIEIRDDGKLIGAGYFDKGQNSIAGILNMYNHNYSKYSLGKYLMLKKIDFAISNNIGLYYTGYISTAINKFDYKIFPDEQAIEVYLPIERKWVSYSFLGKDLLTDYYINHLI